MVVNGSGIAKLTENPEALFAIASFAICDTIITLKSLVTSFIDVLVKLLLFFSNRLISFNCSIEVFVNTLTFFNT